MFAIDPALLSDAAVSDETRAFNARLEATLADLPKTHEVAHEITRKARDEGRGIFPSGGPLEGSEWRDIPAGTGRVRVTLPEGAPRGVHLHIHGGGFALGRPSHYDRQNQDRSREAGCAVLSLEYRLAPEHPFPAGPDDCFEVARWALTEKPFGDLPVTIGGESAGGHLSVVTLLRLREAGLLGAIRGAALNYGVFDLRGTASTVNWGERQLVLSTPTIAFFNEGATTEAQRAEPIHSPLLAELAGLPKALFQIGTCDPLLDDTLMMATRWAAAGNGAELAIHPGGVHAFDMFPDELAIARDFKAREHAFLAACYA